MTTTVTPQTERAIPRPLTDDALQHIDAYWRAANYLSVGQIYLLANPLLREPLALEHIKPRLLGHWGTTPGLNFVYVHLNRVIRERDLDVIYVTPEQHGRGIGTRAMRFVEGAHRATRWTLDTPSWAVRNQHFYEKLGYAKVGETVYPDITLFAYEKRSEGG